MLRFKIVSLLLLFLSRTERSRFATLAKKSVRIFKIFLFEDWSSDAATYVAVLSKSFWGSLSSHYRLFLVVRSEVLVLGPPKKPF